MPDANAMATLIERPGGDRQGLSLDGGWAADLLECDGSPWLAWAACADPEPPLLAPVNWQFPLRREAPLLPGVTPQDWRRCASRAGFSVSLARLALVRDGADGVGSGAGLATVEPRLLAQSAHAVVDAPAATVTHDDRDAPPGEHTYWVRAIQDREAGGSRPHQGVAYSSPVWLSLG